MLYRRWGASENPFTRYMARAFLSLRYSHVFLDEKRASIRQLPTKFLRVARLALEQRTDCLLASRGPATASAIVIDRCLGVRIRLADVESGARFRRTARSGTARMASQLLPRHCQRTREPADARTNAGRGAWRAHPWNRFAAASARCRRRVALGVDAGNGVRGVSSHLDCDHVWRRDQCERYHLRGRPITPAVRSRRVRRRGGANHCLCHRPVRVERRLRIQPSRSAGSMRRTRPLHRGSVRETGAAA